jgi:hypothetical protein
LNPLDFGKEGNDKINLVYLMEKIGKDAEELSVHTQISNYLSSGKYFSALKYGSDPNLSNVSGRINHGGQVFPPVLINTNRFKEEIEKFLTLIMKLKHMKSNTLASQEKENIQISICYLLGFIEEDIYPGIVKEL